MATAAIARMNEPNSLQPNSYLHQFKECCVTCETLGLGLSVSSSDCDIVVQYSVCAWFAQPHPFEMVGLWCIGEQLETM